uniref:TIR domain-containing protein n=1 Tax=Fagus sylvatica TaxID=28930 RepID=A0A2N9FYU9_FAGSY
MDVTASSTSPTSSSSTARWKYDVFLSFRGEDTRNSFTDLIYAALIKEDINTFKDDENLEKGKLISELFKVIEQSRFAIVIFSKDYASSTWCLDELAKIVQCEKDRGMTVLPVFYDVQPSNVRSKKEKGTFARALIEHEKKNTEKVQQWRDALTHMISGNLSYTVSKDTEGLVEKATEKQWPLTYEEISSDLNKLELTMSTIQAVLQDAEEKQVKNQGLTVWLGQVKDVFYDAADVRDEFECEALRRQVVKRHGSTDSASYSSFNPRDFSHKIKVIRERFEEIAKVRAQFHLVKRLDDKLIVQREMTHSFVSDSDVIGRDDDKEKIIDLLMHPNEDGTVPVISIVGIGGLGKTTLAQWVYNDERVAKKFDSRIWKVPMEVRIVVTTRSHKVATVMAPGPIHDLIGLPEDDCLVLFLKWAFVEGEEKKYPKLVEIGKQIVKKCSGVPLAVRTLGSLLYSKTEERDWISIRDNEIWKLEQKEDDILPAFKHLRLLDLRFSTLEALPSSIGTLKHLRYLNLEYNRHIKKLPNSICDLQNLETLILFGCEELEELPRDIRKMNLAALPEWLPNLTSLQKLQIWGCRKLSSLPEGMGRLTALRELKIDSCGELSKNCEREVGVEWPKIKHIPQIEITQ